MILDSEEQRQILLQIINNTSFAGSSLEKALELKMAVINATISNRPGITREKDADT